MRKWVMVSLFSTLLIVSGFNVTVVNASDSGGADSDWELVFSDEFDGTEINMDNWSFDHPENGRYNGEIQSYTDQNAWVEDGNLIIE
ncbi:MAG TPA: glycoside hydrolase family 16 protein, partial [Candidatus Dormibacteraeota bacterium]|nr:glycoside hydrolase family 16 protein [Candidatus Dormibacteraeota bacterium]